MIQRNFENQTYGSVFKNTSLEIHALLRNSCIFQKHVLLRNSCIFHTFIAFRAFFKTSVFLKIPRSKFISNSSQKFRVFSKLPRSENYRLYKFRVFFKEFRVFTKFPGFQIFKSLKNTRKNHLFLYKNIYLQIKNIYKRQAFIFCIIFTVFSSFFSSSKNYM